MNSAIEYSPFVEYSNDKGMYTSLLSALLFTAIIHSVLTWMPIPPPIQHQGNNDWRIISTVQFVSPSPAKAPIAEVKKQASEKAVIEKKPPVKPKEVTKAKPVIEPKPAIKPKLPITPAPEVTEDYVTAPVVETQQTVVETQPIEEQIEETTETEKIAETETTTETAVDANQQPLDTTAVVNNLTASLTNQQPGVPLAEYRSQIIERINANKSYPKTARRRGIQGDVSVRFTVAKDGSVIDLECIADAKLLSKNACEAIKKSQPFPSPKEQHLQLSFVMDYVLR